MQGTDSAGTILALFIPSLLGGLVTAALFLLLATRFRQALWKRIASPLTWLDSTSDRLIFVFIGTYFLVFGAMSALRHESFHSSAYDLGIFDQVIWNTSQGRWFEVTVMIEYASTLLGNHFSPLLLLFVPFYWVIPDVRVLLVLQTAALALGGLPVYWLARDRLGSRSAALMLSTSYFLFPALHYVNLFDFHEIAIASPFLAFAIYYMVSRRYLPFAACLFIALLAREEVGIVAVGFGLWILVVQRQWRWGSGVVVGGAVWAYATIFVLIPYFQGAQDYYYVVRYQHLGSNTYEILKTIALDPLKVLGLFTSQQRVEYMLHLLVPLGLTPVLGLQFLALAFPSLFYLLLSNYKEMYELTNQYSAVLIPSIFMASVQGVVILARRRGSNGNVYLWTAICYVLVSSVVSYYLFSPGPFAKRFRPDRFIVTERTMLGKQIVHRMIPDGASVSAQTDLVPHLSQRKEIYMFPYLHNADYVLLDQQARTWPLKRPEYNVAVEELRSNPDYRMSMERDGFLLFTKVAGYPPYSQTGVKIGNLLEVARSELERSTIDAGSDLEVVVYWRAPATVSDRRRLPRLITSAELVSPGGIVTAGHSKEPGNGTLQTDRWIAGDVVRERYMIPIPTNAEPGEYALSLSIREAKRLSRGSIISYTSNLAKVRVR